MRSCDFDAVVYGGAEWCVGCAPAHKDCNGDECKGGSAKCDECSPIVVDAEADRYPVCDACAYEHDYVSLTAHGLVDRKLRQLVKDHGVDEFDAASGLYWWLAEHHGGQWSEEYAMLSVLQYKPGASERELGTDDAKAVYKALCDEANCDHDDDSDA